LFLGTARKHDLFLFVLEQARKRYQFVVVGYVVMPEHVHLLISEPQHKDPSTICRLSSWDMHVLKMKVRMPER